MTPPHGEPPPTPTIVTEVGRVELARAKRTTVVVGYTAAGDIGIRIDGPAPIAALSPQGANKLNDLLDQARAGHQE